MKYDLKGGMRLMIMGIMGFATVNALAPDAVGTAVALAGVAGIAWFLWDRGVIDDIQNKDEKSKRPGRQK